MIRGLHIVRNEIPVSALRGQLVLVAEHEPMLALSTSYILAARGAEVITAQSVARALDVLQRREITAAVLAVELSDGAIGPVCRTLNAIAVPYVFAVAASPQRQGPWDDTVLLEKPIEPRALATALASAFVEREHRMRAENAHTQALRRVSVTERRILRQYRRLSLLRRDGLDDSGPFEMLQALETELPLLRAAAQSFWVGAA